MIENIRNKQLYFMTKIDVDLIIFSDIEEVVQ